MRSPYNSVLKLLCGALIGVGMGLCSHLPSANAAEKIIIRFSAIEQAISVPELKKFAETGEQSNTIRAILEQVKLNPELMRAALGSSIDIKQYDLDLVLVDRLLNSYVAEIFLQEFGKSFHPPRTEAASVQALRSTVIAAIADDNKISAIEFLEKYPTDLVMEGELVTAAYQRFSKDVQDLSQPLGRLLQKLQRRP